MNNEMQTVVGAFDQTWKSEALGSQSALIGTDRTLSYPELHFEVSRLAGKLRAQGISDGQRVAIAMERSVDLAVTLLAVLVAGACPCVIEPKLGMEETARRVSMTKLKWLVVDAAHAHDPALEQLSDIRRIVLAELHDAEPYWAQNLDSDSPGFLLFTSGSSGKPKGVLQSHRGLQVNALGVIAHSELTPRDRLLHIMPLYHTNGVNNQLFAALMAGSTVIFADRFRADDMPALLETYRPTIVTGVPTMYSRMLDKTFSPNALSCVRMLRCGSAPITEELHRRIEARFGKPLIVSYGLSEATCTSTMNPPQARRIGSVGTVLQGQHLYLADANGRVIEPPGREGEICISGPSLMLGYILESSGGEPVAPGERLQTGDLGRFDNEGYLFITGRIKDVIIRGGENLSPTLIESVLVKVPGVAACCVVGKADTDLGEVAWAFVVRTTDSQGSMLTDDQLSTAVQQELSRVHKPAAYVYVEALPENSVGKVDRKALAARLAAAPV